MSGADISIQLSRNSILQAFVVSEVNGAWRRAIEVPGTDALNSGQFASVNAVSCRSHAVPGYSGEMMFPG